MTIPTDEPPTTGGLAEEEASASTPMLAASSRWRTLGRVWAVIGIVAGFFFLIIPGAFAIRSYRRWRAGSIPSPIFAWTFAWLGVAAMALSLYSAWALYHLPLVEDDFSDRSSGWPVEAGSGWSLEYDEGGYRMESTGVGGQGSSLAWGEGALPNVAVEADVLMRSGDAASVAGVGCLVDEEVGYLFAVGRGSLTILAIDRRGVTELTMKELSSTVRVVGSTNRIRGECRAGFGEARLTMYVNGVEVAEAIEPDGGEYRAFRAIQLRVGSGSGDRVDVYFDNVFVIGIEPS